MMIFVFVLPISISSNEQKNKYINNTLKCSHSEYRIYESTIKILDYKDLPYNKGVTSIWKQSIKSNTIKPVTYSDNNPNKHLKNIKINKKGKKDYYDDNSNHLFNYKGKLVYHPVAMAVRGLNILRQYNTTGNIKKLEEVKKIADQLLRISIPYKGVIYFPFTFDHILDRKANAVITSPWYSAMAQGQVLSLFIRLYEITNEKIYLDSSHKIFNSFNTSFYNKENLEPWVACVDENKNLWLEEYPQTPASYVLNGMIFAIYGAYDYYRITKDKNAEKILRGSILTIKDTIYKFRVRSGEFEVNNGISYYCLKYPNLRLPKYHNKVHVGQLEMLYKMTGDDYFLEMSKKFASDTKRSDVKINLQKNTLSFVLRPKLNNTKAVFYLYHNDKHISSQWYSKNLIYSLDKNKLSSGNYRVKFFLIDEKYKSAKENGYEEVGYSGYINIEANSTMKIDNREDSSATSAL